MNKKDIIKLVITGVLVIVLLILINNSRSAVSKAQDLRKKTLNAPELTMVQQQEEDPQNFALSGSAGVGPQAGKMTYKKLAEHAKNQMAVRDPFSNLPMSVRSESVSNALTLSGILWDKVKPLAVINNNVVKVGDKVGGGVVAEIKQDRVVLKEGSITREIKLGQ
jgi:hypothetical protein